MNCSIMKPISDSQSLTINYLELQTSQLSRFGRETHDFLTDLTTTCQSHDFSRFSRNIIINVRLIPYKCHVIHMYLVLGLDRKVSNYEAARDDKFCIESGVKSLDSPVNRCETVSLPVLLYINTLN